MKINLLRLTGFFYLLVIICAGTSQGYIRGTLIIPNDIVATAKQISANLSLFRFGITLDLIAFMLDVVISIFLYQIVKGAGKTLALITAAFRLIAHPALGSLNLLNHYYGYQVLSKEHVGAYSQNQLETLSMFFLEGHSFGYLIAGSFFGIHCILLGVAIYRSKIVPNIIGGFLLGSGIGYLIESFGNFNLPGYEMYTAIIVGITAALGELSLTLYLLFTRKKVAESSL